MKVTIINKKKKVYNSFHSTVELDIFFNKKKQTNCFEYQITEVVHYMLFKHYSTLYKSYKP